VKYLTVAILVEISGEYIIQNPFISKSLGNKAVINTRKVA
jgi:hypothetical protein